MLPAALLAAHVSFLCPTPNDAVTIYCETARALVTLVNRPIRRLILVDRTTKGLTTDAALTQIDVRRRLGASDDAIE